MVQDSNALRGKWIAGRVIEVYPGQDGKVRNVKVKTPTGEYSRPITKIAVVQPAEGFELDGERFLHRGGGNVSDRTD